ncbi:MAG: hypothetical protein ACPF8V_05995 [Luteibaculum sp.]
MRKLLLFALAIITFSACDKYLGDRTDTDFLTPPEFSQRPAFYVPVQPALQGFLAPTDVLYGFDELIYIVDSIQERIFAYDQSGMRIGSIGIPGVTRVAQDRKLDLLAIGKKDTTINGQSFSLSTIYRIDITQGARVDIGKGQIINELVHPFYYKNTLGSDDANTQLTDIAVFGDNEFYVSRIGKFPGSNTIPPDDAVIIFNNQDKYQGPVFVNSDGSFVRNFFKKPVGLTTFMQPPQTSAQANRRDFIYCSADSSQDNAFRVRTIRYFSSENGAGYEAAAPAEQDTSKADGFINTPNKFKSPKGITIAGDGSNYIFVVDNTQDSLYQFTGNGLEGVPPPSSSSDKKNVIVSFGGNGIGLTEFKIHLL